MLKQIRLIDFKSFVDEEVTLAPLTLLVGANASGKSNFLDSLWFLHGLTLGLEVGEVLDGEEPAHRNGEPWPALRGGSREASRLGTTRFEIRTVWSGFALPPPNVPPSSDIPYRIICQTKPAPRIDKELSDSLVIAADALVSGLGEGPGPGGLSSRLAQAIGQVRQIAIRPERMRDYGQLKRPLLATDGTNFSGALHHLCMEREERQNLVDWLSELLAPEIADVDFIEVKELGDVMAVFVEKDGTRVSARSLSDGTLRFLGLLLSLRQAEPGSTLLIEEVDSGLHPTRIRVLMELLRQATRDRGVQVIATTHDPTCLEYAGDEALQDTIVLGRVPEHSGTIMRRLGDLPHFDEVIKGRGISDLFTTGWLEMAL